MALGFLTLFPVGWRQIPGQRAISNSRAYYPLVGLLLGLLLLGVVRSVGQLTPVALTAGILLVLPILVTRGLHLDGFMDICDGLFGGYTPERRLEIMQDSRVGAFAVAGVVGLLILKYSALVSLLSLPGSAPFWVLPLVPVVSRWSMVLLLGFFPYVRNQGLGSPFHQGGHWTSTLAALAMALAAALVMGGIGGLVILVGVSALAWVFGWMVVRMLGGLVGDAYGAANEISEVAAIIGAVILVPLGLIMPLFQVSPIQFGF